MKTRIIGHPFRSTLVRFAVGAHPKCCRLVKQLTIRRWHSGRQGPQKEDAPTRIMTTKRRRWDNNSSKGLKGQLTLQGGRGPTRERTLCLVISTAGRPAQGINSQRLLIKPTLLSWCISCFSLNQLWPMLRQEKPQTTERDKSLISAVRHLIRRRTQADGVQHSDASRILSARSGLLSLRRRHPPIKKFGCALSTCRVL